jgi:hypothetical protein
MTGVGEVVLLVLTLAAILLFIGGSLVAFAFALRWFVRWLLS